MHRLQHVQVGSTPDVPQCRGRVGSPRYTRERRPSTLCSPVILSSPVRYTALRKVAAKIQTLSPGYIRTAMTDELLAQRPDFKKQWLSGSMLERLSTPDEFRGPVIYLLSRASSFMTGADMIVDGGHTAW